MTYLILTRDIISFGEEKITILRFCISHRIVFLKLKHLESLHNK